MFYSKDGNVLGETMHLDYEYDSTTNANYTVLRIYQTKTDGTKQYPFLYAPNGVGQATMSALTMNKQRNFDIAINAGIGGTYTVEQGVIPIGVLIENGVLLQQESSEWYILTIDEDGNLDYAEPNTSGATLISNGIVSAVVGFCPIIVDYEPVDPSIYTPMPHDDQNAQRQIIGQFGNGDYAIITCEGRDYDHSDGWTIPEAITICQKLGLKFAYNLDGGGSTETVIGKKQINTIYENAEGRKVPNFLVFNGTDTYGVPNN